jgi:hypothetical protein
VPPPLPLTLFSPATTRSSLIPHDPHPCHPLCAPTHHNHHCTPCRDDFCPATYGPQPQPPLFADRFLPAHALPTATTCSYTPCACTQASAADEAPDCAEQRGPDRARIRGRPRKGVVTDLLYSLSCLRRPLLGTALAAVPCHSSLTQNFTCTRVAFVSATACCCIVPTCVASHRVRTAAYLPSPPALRVALVCFGSVVQGSNTTLFGMVECFALGEPGRAAPEPSLS